jgi:hypothetical protein
MGRAPVGINSSDGSNTRPAYTRQEGRLCQREARSRSTRYEKEDTYRLSCTRSYPIGRLLPSYPLEIQLGFYRSFAIQPLQIRLSRRDRFGSVPISRLDGQFALG